MADALQPPDKWKLTKWASPIPESSEVQRKRRQDRDFFSREIFHGLENPTVMLQESSAEVVQITEMIWWEARQKFPDYLVSVDRVFVDGEWVLRVAVQVEFVDRLNREELKLQLRVYELLIVLQFGPQVRVVPHVVVVGPHGDDMPDWLEYGFAPDGTELRARILYFDHLELSKLSDHDRNSFCGIALNMVQYGQRDETSVARAFEAALAAPTEALRQKRVELVMSGCTIWADDLLKPWVRVRQRKEEEMGTAVTAKVWDEATDEFLRIKSVEERVNQTLVEPKSKAAYQDGRKEGHQEGHEEGKRSNHVQNLLAVLRERTIELDEKHKTKLKEMPCDKLPPMSDAVHAADAEDFVRRAGLDD